MEMANKIAGKTNGTGTITKEQATRIEKYVEMARRNEQFSTEQAQEFNYLCELLIKERSEDKGAWGIFLLANIIRAIYCSK